MSLYDTKDDNECESDQENDREELSVSEREPVDQDTQMAKELISALANIDLNEPGDPKPASRSLFAMKESNMQRKDTSIVPLMCQAFATYQSLKSNRTKASAFGFLSSAATFGGWLLRNYLESTKSVQGMAYATSSGEKWLYFALGLSLGIAVHSEVRWALTDKKNCKEAKTRAFKLAQKVIGSKKPTKESVQEAGKGSNDRLMEQWSQY